MNAFNRWLRSKQGKTTLGAIVALVLVVALVAGVASLIGTAGGKKGEPTPTTAPLVPTATPLPGGQYTAPTSGISCLPTCATNDGKFLVLAGTNVRSFAGSTINMWIAVPSNAQTFELSFFDGDSGRDVSGGLYTGSWMKGNWDNGIFEVTYTVWPDPSQTGALVDGVAPVASWKGNENKLPNNGWFTVNLPNKPEALGAGGDYYFYLLRVEAAPGPGWSVFKVSSSGYLSSGQGDLVGSSIGIIPSVAGPQDLAILYPQMVNNDQKNPGPSNYSGDWTFFFYVPQDAKSIEFWDGDMDRGTSSAIAADTDDPNTVGLPPFSVGVAAVPERAGGQGYPNDNYSQKPIFMRGDPVYYEIVDPDGITIYKNDDPSGTEEWEKFVVARQDSGIADADMYASNIKAGVYVVNIKGLDIQNAVWFYVNQQVCDGPTCDFDKRAFCPRTIGYWKNNVKKVLIEQRTNGVQETPESIHQALDIIAQMSPLYRSGLNPANPDPITKVARLSDLEADAIMQKNAGNTPLDRALQQNLATWLNMASGKVGAYTQVTINTANGSFTGSVLDALRTAEQIILAGDEAQMLYAKDLADMINNGQVDVDPAENLDANGAPVCGIYDTVIPKDKQRPEKLPKAPKPAEPPAYVPAPPPDPATCTGRENNYTVESSTNNPFYGIKFNYASGTEVKGGDSDIFSYTLPAQAVQGMTTMQLEAKAGQIILQAEMACDFTSTVPCSEPVGDTNSFTFQFLGAVDNGDGTMTLTFQVWNYTQFGLSHATFGLPQGAVPSTPTGSYTSKICAP